MKKLTVLFSIAALSLTLGAAGCKKKNAEEGKDPAMKPEEKGSADMAAKPDDKKPEEKKDMTAPPATATGDVPTECSAYKAAVDKMMGCDKMKDAAAGMKTGFDNMWKQMEALPAEGRAAMGAGCKAGADAIQQSLTAMGC